MKDLPHDFFVDIYIYHKNGGVVFLQRKTKETPGLINPENNRIGGKRL
jgi:hypothetical protein